MNLAPLVLVALLPAAAAFAEASEPQPALHCAKQVSPKEAGKLSPLLEFGLAEAVTAVCVGPDGRSMFWEHAGAHVSIGYSHAVGNWRNHHWRLKTDARGAAVLNTKAWKMLSCTEYVSPQPVGDGGPRTKAVWELRVSRSKDGAVDVGTGWVASPIATPPKHDAKTFRKHVSGGRCTANSP